MSWPATTQLTAQKFVSSLCQRPPIGPVLPVPPVYNSFAVNNLAFSVFHGMEEVIGSIPIRSTTLFPNNDAPFLLVPSGVSSAKRGHRKGTLRISVPAVLRQVKRPAMRRAFIVLLRRADLLVTSGHENSSVHIRGTPPRVGIHLHDACGEANGDRV